MPYKKFKKKGKYCIKNIRTGRVTCYGSEAKRAKGIRLKEAFSHGWKPTRIKVRMHTRKGKKVREHKRRIKKRLFYGKEDRRRNLELNLPTREDPEKIRELTFKQVKARTLKKARRKKDIFEPRDHYGEVMDLSEEQFEKKKRKRGEDW